MTPTSGRVLDDLSARDGVDGLLDDAAVLLDLLQ
jgi:hypothetical protein